MLPHRRQNYLLLVASYIFYGWWDYRFLSLIMMSTAVDYYVALQLHRATKPSIRKSWLILSIVVNLGVLSLFKYFSFFSGSLASLLTLFGIRLESWILTTILPVGISFYTFQSMSYTIDVYREKIKPTQDFLDFALFVSFFPQLVAGPIERASNLLRKIQTPRVVTWEDWRVAAMLFLMGLFKKAVVADFCMAPIADKAFADPGACSRGLLVAGVYAFSFQIYMDFSGYTDMARGIARFMGIELMENFRQPYFARSFPEFWRRWHISLSTWLRDYLYIPLGGNRKGQLTTYRNLFLTMLLGGLWHGAAWTFVAWGGLHGVYLAVHRMAVHYWPSRIVSRRSALLNRVVTALKILVVFNVTSITWVFFRASSFSSASEYLKGIFSLSSETTRNVVQRLELGDVIIAAVAVTTLMFLIDIPQAIRRTETPLLEWSLPAAALGILVLLLWIVLAQQPAPRPFIYFQF